MIGKGLFLLSSYAWLAVGIAQYLVADHKMPGWWTAIRPGGCRSDRSGCQMFSNGTKVDVEVAWSRSDERRASFWKRKNYDWLVSSSNLRSDSTVATIEGWSILHLDVLLCSHLA